MKVYGKVNVKHALLNPYPDGKWVDLQLHPSVVLNSGNSPLVPTG
jgi:hypothetical protein